MALVALIAAIGGSFAQQPVGFLAGPPVRLGLEVPSWVLWASAALGGVALLLLIVLIIRSLTPDRRKKKPDDEIIEEIPYRHRFSALTGLAFLAIVIGALAGVFVLMRQHQSGETNVTAAGTGNPLPTAQGLFHQHALAPVSWDPASGGAIFLLVVTSALFFGLMAYLFLPPWLGIRTSAAPATRRASRAIPEEQLPDIDKMLDPRLAILACYARFERLASKISFPRPPADTAREFMRAILHQRRLPEQATAELTRLFELSKFSSHPITQQERLAAVNALGAIDAALPRKEQDSP